MQESIRVANIFLSPLKGGVEIAHVNMASLLQKSGAWVMSIAHPDSGYLDALAKASNKVATHHANGFYDLFSSWRLQKLLAREEIDIIIAHNSRACQLAQRFKPANRRLIGVSHSNKSARMHGPEQLLVLTPKMLEQFKADGFPAHSLSIFPNLYEGIVIPPTPGSGHVLGFMGRLVEEKGIADLIFSISHLITEIPEIELRIAGAGPLLPSILNQVTTLGLANRVHFDGWIENKEDWFSRIDTLVVPSHVEPFGIVVLEGIAHGKPVIASSTEGPLSILDSDSLKPALYAPGNIDELASRIRLFLNNHKARLQWVKNAQPMLNKYSASTLSITLKEILERTSKK